MEFYQMFSNYYDIIFPFADAKKTFFAELITKINPATALDLGSATGELCNWLATQGVKATGADLSPHLLQQARERQQPGADFLLTDIVSFLKKTSDTYDLIVCIGNTLPHLKPEELTACIIHLTERLAPGGTLVVQTVNYHRIMQQKPPGLPIIQRLKAGTTLIRLYDYNRDGSITFTARLETPEGADSAAVTLWPFTAADFITQLPRGITVVSEHGGFDRLPYNGDESPAWVLVAMNNV